jgi:hypothetical protein
MTKVHILKTYPESFDALEDGSKTFEIRKNDRNYNVGDILFLKEFIPETSKFTTRWLVFHITYICKDGTWNLPKDMCVMGLELVCSCKGMFNTHDEIYALHHTVYFLIKNKQLSDAQLTEAFANTGLNLEQVNNYRDFFRKIFKKDIIK